MKKYFLLLLLFFGCKNDDIKIHDVYELKYVVYYPSNNDTILKFCRQYYTESSRGTNYIGVQDTNGNYYNVYENTAPVKVLSVTRIK